MSGGRRSQGAADGMVGVLAYQHAHASLTGQRGSGRGRIWSGSARSTIHILLMPPPPQEGKMQGSLAGLGANPPSDRAASSSFFFAQGERAPVGSLGTSLRSLGKVSLWRS